MRGVPKRIVAGSPHPVFELPFRYGFGDVKRLQFPERPPVFVFR
jgi:hypothetical protein